MSRVRLGLTGMEIERMGFGALPIQRISEDEAAKLVRRAFEGGMDFFDTAHVYSDSEKKLGRAFAGIRDEVRIATKAMAKTPDEFWDQLHTSLMDLRTDHIDLYQLHNPAFCPKPGGDDGLYDALVEAKRQGKVLHIGITNHRLNVAREAIASGLYETLQFPLSYLASEDDLDILGSCEKQGMGFIAMKALSGGLISNARAACAWLMQYSTPIPIWGIQRDAELREILPFIDEQPVLTDELRAAIAEDRAQLQGDFCRGCGYCMPCPQGIAINTCARMSLLIRRAPTENFTDAAGREMMEAIEGCTECGQCKEQCPYGLDTPELLKRNLQDYREVLAGKPL